MSENNNLDNKQVTNLIRLALEEDLADGDITSRLCIDKAISAEAEIVARENLILCGTDLVNLIARERGISPECRIVSRDGSSLKDGDVIVELKGSARELLEIERTCLNFLQHLSGISTYTSSVMNLAEGMTVLDTRKTTPGWRYLEKYAVRTGGGKNHRMSLGDMILVKDNHIAANNNSVKETLELIYQNKPSEIKVEVEVSNREELLAALPFKPDRIMLDNMSDNDIASAVQTIRGTSDKIEIEVSGQVRAADLERLKSIGVTMVSTSSIITKATSVDISMNLKLLL